MHVRLYYSYSDYTNRTEIARKYNTYQLVASIPLAELSSTRPDLWARDLLRFTKTAAWKRTGRTMSSGDILTCATRVYVVLPVADAYVNHGDYPISRDLVLHRMTPTQTHLFRMLHPYKTNR